LPRIARIHSKIRAIRGQVFSVFSVCLVPWHFQSGQLKTAVSVIFITEKVVKARTLFSTPSSRRAQGWPKIPLKLYRVLAIQKEDHIHIRGSNRGVTSAQVDLCRDVF